MGPHSTWKEKNHTKPYYDLVRPNDDIPANFHGVPCADKDLDVFLDDDFIDRDITEAPCSRLVITFERKLIGAAATKWVQTFCSRPQPPA
jgi:hypothetical protein